MSTRTERLIQLAAVVGLLWFGWGLARDTIVAQLTLANRTAIADQRLRQCEADRAILLESKSKSKSKVSD